MPSAAVVWPAATRALPPAPTVPTGGQRIGARLVDGILHLVLLGLAFLLVPDTRTVARLFVGAALITAYEALFTNRTGATPGKLIAGTKVVELDLPRVDPATAAKRGLMAGIGSLVVAFAPIIVVSSFAADAEDRGAVIVLGMTLMVLAAGILVSVLGSTAGRSFIDRICGTFVVSRTTATPFTTAQLDALADAKVAPAATPWGPMATFEQRRRGRAGRLDDAPFLVLALLVIVFTTSVPSIAPIVIVLLGLTWEVVFVADETWRVARTAGTSGHRSQGLAVVDVDTGEAPEPLNALVRAVLVSLPLYMLPAAAILSAVLIAEHPMALVGAIVSVSVLAGFVLWPRVSGGRGLHDLAAHTVVISPRPTGQR